MLTTRELMDSHFQDVVRETVRDGEKYVVIKVVRDGYTRVFDDVYIAAANVTDNGNVRFTHNSETVECSVNPGENFYPVDGDGFHLVVVRITPKSLKMRDEIAHIVAANRLRRQAAELMAGLRVRTAEGEIDRVLALRNVVNELAAHESSINQKIAPHAPDRFQPLVEIPKQRVPEN